MGMVRRRTRRRTMMVAGGVAYARGRKQGQQDVGPREEENVAPLAPGADDATSELERLASLHQSGELSDDEFATEVHLRYSATWDMIGKMLDKHGHRAEAARAFEHAKRLAPR